MSLWQTEVFTVVSSKTCISSQHNLGLELSSSFLWLLIFTKLSVLTWCLLTRKHSSGSSYLQFSLVFAAG